MPLLRAGYIVLCDRYIFTAYVRDTVRGCSPDWVRGLYNFAALPDLTFFFKADLEVSLSRILDGRPELKYFEAGMDFRPSTVSSPRFCIFLGGLFGPCLGAAGRYAFFEVGWYPTHANAHGTGGGN